MENGAGGHAVGPHHPEIWPAIASAPEASRNWQPVCPEVWRIHMSLSGEPHRPARSRVRRCEKSRPRRDRDRGTRSAGGQWNARGGHPLRGRARVEQPTRTRGTVRPWERQPRATANTWRIDYGSPNECASNS